MTLYKRNNQGFDIAPSLIIFFVILGAGFLVCCGFAIFRYAGEDPGEQHDWNKRSPAQDAYMKQVRLRNREELRRIAARHAAGPANRNQARTPMSTGDNSTTTHG